MSYLVLARKYRPTSFAEVIGQEHVTRTLANSFASGRVHHAFLFCGPRGCGKTTLARIVGKALNCERGATADPCGVCSACKSINEGSAVDYIEMDGASNRGIDAIRELTEAVRYQPAVLRKKVYVIDEVHMLTTEAFNALLKTLEEPPPHVTFVLATTEPHKLPNTILSRCQRYDFKLVPASRLAHHLASIFTREQLKIDTGALGLVVRESGGSVRDALSLCDQVISYVGDMPIGEAQVAEVLGVADRSLTRSLVRALATGEVGTALAAVDLAIGRGVDEVQIARAIVRYLRDLAVVQVAPERGELTDASEEERTELRAEARSLERGRVTQMFDRMLRCCDELGKTLLPRLVLECALIDVATIEPLVPLGDLLSRLAELETRVRAGGGVGQPLKRKLDVPTGSPASVSIPAVVAAPVATAPSSVPVAPMPSPVLAPSGPVLAPSGPVPKIEKAATGSGPHAIPVTDADALREWEHVLATLATQNITVSGAYEPARVLVWTIDRLELGFPARFETNKELAESKDKLEALAAVLQREFAQTPKISIRLVDDAQQATRSVLEASREKSTAERTKREAEAREHPITKHVLHTFGAQIKEIKTDV